MIEDHDMLDLHTALVELTGGFGREVSTSVVEKRGESQSSPRRGVADPNCCRLYQYTAVLGGLLSP
jgi:hypothetical protein